MKTGHAIQMPREEIAGEMIIQQENMWAFEMGVTEDVCVQIDNRHNRAKKELCG